MDPLIIKKGVSMVKNDRNKAHDEVRAMLSADYFELGNWRAVARRRRVTSATARRIVLENHEPDREDIREALGYLLTEKVAVCPVHGVVHVNACPEVKKTKQTRIYKDLLSIPVSVLKWKFENREVLPREDR
jgi:hypothetical protein